MLEPKWVRLIHGVAIALRHYVVFVEGSLAGSRDKPLPYPRRRLQPQRVRVALPSVEVSDDRYALRIRRPNREIDAVLLALLA